LPKTQLSSQAFSFKGEGRGGEGRGGERREEKRREEKGECYFISNCLLTVSALHP
jgi:hypothetical protein